MHIVNVVEHPEGDAKGRTRRVTIETLMSEEILERGKVVDIEEARRRRAVEQFRAAHGRDPDFVDELEENPRAPVERIAFALDYHRYISAQVMAQLAVAQKHGITVDLKKANEVLDRFRMDGVYTEALARMQSDLGELNFGIYDQIEGKVPAEELEAETDRILASITEEGKHIREDSF
ncbi:MAG: hypothetical protein A3H76_01025 [Candidatus Lloydbacteria bacterium RIFCSPLOWO2_02_FULL_54_12]|nr:MAG: hypothetical protein A3H76_01025 [Candidatus Lloydbacteria bacterium RIFCSPLOWO2_02_FULL_54_12]